MVKRLSEHGLLEHVPYRGVQLTEEGRRAALRMVRRHRLIEAYLVEFLGYSWDTVHEEAERLEHAVSDTHDRADGRRAGQSQRRSPWRSHSRRPTAPFRSLPALRSPISRLAKPWRSTGFMRASRNGCATSPHLGFVLECGSRVVDRQPFDDLVTIEVGGERHVIGRELGHALQCARREAR